MADTTPSTIRGYEIRAKIGEGGFGAVYRAYQPSVGREVAIKVILPKYANHPDFIRRFEAEAQLVARLEHMNIIPLHDYWREPDGAYLVMRYFRGGTLKDRLERDGQLADEDALRLVDQIAAALSVAHRHGVIHRDLKPANILLDDDGNAFLTDFGIAKDISRPGQLTQEDAMIGSPAYLSPEQIKSDPVAPQADIYSLGVVIFEVLTGAHPFGDLPSGQLLVKHLQVALPPLESLRSDLPDAVNQVVQKATAKSAVDRYRDTATLATALRQAMTVPETVKDGEVTLTPVSQPPTIMENPYKGLRAFQEADVADFFGREALIHRLLERLQEDDPLARFLALVGPSGSGKSSIVRAGLIPALRNGKLPGSENWFVANMLPGTHPLEELELALIRVASESDLDLLPLLREDERGLSRAIRRILPEGETLLLVVDQFEEAFILADDTSESAQFIEGLHAALIDPRSPLRVIVTLRADFYDRPLMIPGFSELMRQRTEVITPMAATELERAIVAPAQRVGLQVEPGLVAAMVAEVNEQPGALPMFQYALTELYDHRENHALTLAVYHDLGGVMGVLAGRADEVYGSLTDEEQAAARQLFLRLVTLGEGTEDTRRRTRQSELISAGGAVVLPVIDAFDHSRLLTFDRDPQTREPTVEVAHEAILREWGQLRAWLDESRHDIRQQRLLDAAAHEWLAHERDDGYLLHGSRLDEFAGWAADTSIALTADEQTFLKASFAEHERQATEERQRQQRELDLQRQAANRLRYIVAGLAAFLVVAVLLAFFALNARSDAETERDNADVARANAEREALLNRSLALAGEAKEALLTLDTDLAVALALEAYSMVDDPPPEVEDTLFEALYAPGTSRVLRGHEGVVSCVDISPDGRYAVSGGGRPLAWEYNKAYERGFVTYDIEDYSVRLWDLQTGAELHRMDGHTDMVWDVAFTPDGRSVLSASADKTLILWDVETGAEIRRFEGHVEPIISLALSPDGTTALSYARDGRLIHWDIATGTAIRTSDEWQNINIGEWGVVVFSPDGQHAALTSGETISTDITVWNLATGDVTYQPQPAPQFEIRALAFSPDGQYLVGGGKMAVPDTFGLNDILSAAYLWELGTGTEVRSFLQDGIETITGVAFSADGRYLVTVSGSQHLMLWHIDTGQLVLTLSGHTDWITDVAFSSDGRYLVTSSEDGTVRRWDTWNGAETHRLPGYNTGILTLSFSPDGQTILAGTQHRVPTLWDALTGDIIYPLRGHNRVTLASAFSPDGRFAVTGSDDETLRLWDVATGEVIQTIETSRSVRYLAVTADNRYIIAAEPGGAGGNITSEVISLNSNRLTLWDIATEAPVRHFLGHGSYVFGLDISPDGRTVLSASLDETMRLWDIATGETLHIYETPGGRVWRVVFSPDGRSFLGGGTKGQLTLWDIDSGNIIRRFEGHSSDIYGVDISPDGRYAISVAHDNVMVLWDMETGQALRRFQGVSWIIGAVAFSPDGFHAVSGDTIGNVIMWRLFDTPNEIIAWAHDNRYIRHLTCSERVLFDVTPLCDETGIVATRTPYPALTDSPPPTIIPTLDATLTTHTPTWTPLPTVTPQPTATPLPIPELQFGETVAGRAQPSSFGQPPEEWAFQGVEGQSITITNQNTFGLVLKLYDPDNAVVLETTDTLIGPLSLPTTGTYTITVQTGEVELTAGYQLTVEEAFD